jgi:DsbC/DsbD-like thiol-disulfide interchange protein
MAVTATFETSAAELGPESSFLVAMHFQIAEGYRLSWLNPGDMGKEMAIDFKVPEGFEVSAPMFPGPNKYSLPDGFVSYGYDGETAVFAEVRVPPDVVPNDVYRFEVSAEWLACKHTCLKEATSAYFELVATDQLFDQGFDGELPAIYDRVPKPISKLDTASLEWRDASRLAIIAEGIEWKDYFPARPDQPVPKVNQQSGEVILDFEQSALGSAVQGVLLAERDGQPLYFALDEPPP